MKTHMPVRASSKPATGSENKSDLAPLKRSVQAAASSTPQQGALHDFSRMELPFRSSGADEIVHAAARHGLSTPSAALPHVNRIQRAFGRHDVSAARAHAGPEAAGSARAIGTMAYTAGPHVVLDRAADLRTVAHEAAHVVQQRHGVQLAGGIGRVGDSYERHADAVADRVVAGHSAEPLLDRIAPAGTTTTATDGFSVQARINPVSKPGQVAHYTQEGHTVGHDSAPQLQALMHKMLARQEITAAKATTATSVAKPIASTMSSASAASLSPARNIGNNEIERAFATNIDSKSRSAVDRFDAAKGLTEATFGKLNISHKLSSHEIQDTIKRTADEAVKQNGAPDWSEVKTLVDGIDAANNWAQGIDSKDAKEYLQIIGQSHADATAALADAKKISDGALRESGQVSDRDPDGAKALNNLACSISNSPVNLFIGSASVNSSMQAGADVNVTEADAPSPIAQRPGLNRTLTPESLRLVKRPLITNNANPDTKRKEYLDKHQASMNEAGIEPGEYDSFQTSSIPPNNLSPGFAALPKPASSSTQAASNTGMVNAWQPPFKKTDANKLAAAGRSGSMITGSGGSSDHSMSGGAWPTLSMTTTTNNNVNTTSNFAPGNTTGTAQNDYSRMMLIPPPDFKFTGSTASALMTSSPQSQLLQNPSTSSSQSTGGGSSGAAAATKPQLTTPSFSPYHSSASNTFITGGGSSHLIRSNSLDTQPSTASAPRQKGGLIPFFDTASNPVALNSDASSPTSNSRPGLKKANSSTTTSSSGGAAATKRKREDDDKKSGGKTNG